MHICCTFAINTLRMVKFRQNHGKSAKGGFMSRIVTFTVFLILAICGLFYTMKDSIVSDKGRSQSRSVDRNYTPPPSDIEKRNFLPKGSKGELVHHTFYSLSYSEKHEQAEWVAYKLTKSSLQAKNVPRAKRFNADYSVKSQSAFHSDYTHSGYTRGHMAPAGDMAFSEQAMKETFLMSNMSPQTRGCNNGVWKELEEQVRDWAYDDKEVYIVTGPFLDNVSGRIGKKNKVSIPTEFFKIILDIEGSDKKAIAFIIPNDTTDATLQSYAVSIDHLESRLGIDFFANLLDERDEDKLESSFDLSKWEFDKKRYKSRVEKWNNQ